jgi:hypothetical protein
MMNWDVGVGRGSQQADPGSLAQAEQADVRGMNVRWPPQERDHRTRLLNAIVEGLLPPVTARATEAGLVEGQGCHSVAGEMVPDRNQVRRVALHLVKMKK